MAKNEISTYVDTYVQKSVAGELDVSEYVEVAKTAKTLVAKTEHDYETFGHYVRDIKEKTANLTEQRNRVLKPLKAAVKEIEGWFKPALNALAEAEGSIKGAMLAFRAQQQAENERLALEAQKKMAEGRAKEAVAMVAKMDLNGPAAKGVSSRKTWKARVVDESLVPREFLSVNQTALDSFAKATKGAKAVPGVEFFEQETLAVRL